MSEQLAFLSLKYGNILPIDVHGLTKEEARAELVYTFSSLDSKYSGVLVTHGHHQGTVLKDFIRKDFSHKLLKEKIIIDASRTLLLVDWSNSEHH